jgi:hypothetical protein
MAGSAWARAGHRCKLSRWFGRGLALPFSIIYTIWIEIIMIGINGVNSECV